MIKYTDLVRLVVFLAFGLPAAFIDARTLRIPDILSLGGIIAFLLFEILVPSDALFSRIAGGVFGFLLFLLLRVTTKGLGFGDVKYAGFVGLYSGLRLYFVVLLGASCFALLFALIMKLMKKENRGQKIPFAPFLTLGGICAMLVR
jgi:prepilin signal peptidase PulO-like enzyme (type II secretory pathway)